MKKEAMKLRIPVLSLLFLFVFSLTACKKDKLEKELVGDWAVKSFTIDGVEAKGVAIKASRLEFEETKDDKGDFEWSINYTDGSSDIENGEYEIDTDKKEIELEDADGDRIKFDFDLEDDELELSGTIDGQRVVVKAEKD
jgi:hypothetical protein